MRVLAERSGAAISTALLFSCAPARGTLPHLTAAQLTESIRGSEVRAHAPTRPYVQSISIAIREELSGRGFEGHGLLGVQPRHALRMVLLGPGGTTAMDVWMRDGKWRVSIPPIDRIVRGDRKTPRGTMRGLPIDLLERWVVAPWDGAIVTAHRGTVERDGSIASALSPAEGFVVWIRRVGATEIREETSTSARGWFFEPRLSGTVQSTQRETDGARYAMDIEYHGVDPAMRVHVTAEPPTFAELPAKTFADPDEASEAP